MTRSQSGAMGGAVDTPAKRRALRRLHAARRGRPVHPEPPPSLDALRRLHAAGLRDHGPMRNPHSISAIAREIGVDNRTLRRWFTGLDRPAPAHHVSIARALLSFRHAL